MTETAVVIADVADVPATWGEPRLARRSGTVTVREPRGRETFTNAWGVLTAEPGVDLVVVQDSGEAYPVKQDIFEDSYEATGEGRYRKTRCSQLVQVPVGAVALLTTREGREEVRHPDFIAIGTDGEVYANSAAWVAANLEWR